jgi:hypothetical protein
MIIDPTGTYRSLGATLNRYIEGQANFGELEAGLAVAIGALPEKRDIFEQLYHVVNHYEIDADIRVDDAQYALLMLSKLREVANSLGSGSPASISRSLYAFWNR